MRFADHKAGWFLTNCRAQALFGLSILIVLLALKHQVYAQPSQEHKANEKQWYTGHVLWANKEKGYGFIRRSNGEKGIFFIYQNLFEDWGIDPQGGDPVCFSIDYARDGRAAAVAISLQSEPLPCG